MKFPRKHLVMMTFLSSMLRDDVRIIIVFHFNEHERNIDLYNVVIFAGWI